MGARISQEGVEPLIIATPAMRVTQEGTEFQGISPRNMRVTQVGVEVEGISPRNMRVTQVGVEFLYVPLNLAPGNPGVIGAGSESTGADMFYPIPPQVSTR